MDRKKRSLEEDVSKVFERACREQDLDVAEHLLRALEAIARRDDDDELRLERAYRELAWTLGEKPERH